MKLSHLIHTAPKKLKIYAKTLRFVARHPDVPIIAKFFAAATFLYAVSPIDLIPDFIPVIGYLDDILIVPLGVYLVIKLTPAHIYKECYQKAQEN